MMNNPLARLTRLFEEAVRVKMTGIFVDKGVSIRKSLQKSGPVRLLAPDEVQVISR